MTLSTVNSAKRIEQQLRTGEEPVLVMCSDVNIYVCKYMRSSATAYKLACELIGSRMAKAWRLNTPDIALVRIKPSHWADINQSHTLSAPSIGSKWMDGVVDITPSTYAKVPATSETLGQLMRIALFDFWIANEDRNANNANLMFDVVNSQLVSIDYGCILNTATFDYPLSQLTTTDTILWSDLFHHLAESQEPQTINTLANHLRAEYNESIQRASKLVNQIVEEMPSEWNIPQSIVSEKLHQLFDNKWKEETWEKFTSCINENIK